ncbi:CAP domain-containing protein [Demequina soli]|uniref:CAP domain-containing protein n=1 Tax=Demequina soli TaxID=1638987 RepID=UPI0009E54ED1|nr:CAP domain-containing protein [Demequina soli]
MTEEQDVLERTRRRRRHAPAILLGGLPVVIASTALAGAYTFVPASASYANGAVDVPAVTGEQPTAAPSITAAEDASDSFEAHPVTVRPAPQPKPTPTATAAATQAPATASSTATRTTAPAATTTSTQAAPAAVDFLAYCAHPQAPSSTSSVSGLLSAVNAERAKAGIAPLSWSGSLASAAASWSRTMAAQDSATSAPADALAHNPNRPGAENVGVIYRSTGMTEGSAMGKLHVNWVYSAGHCGNLMNPAYTQMGAGAAVTDDGTTWYATEEFR